MGKVEEYFYDSQGNLEKTIDKDGNTTVNKYDVQSRVADLEVNIRLFKKMNIPLTTS